MLMQMDRALQLATGQEIDFDQYVSALSLMRHKSCNTVALISVHKQMYWIRMNLRMLQPSNVFVTFECLYYAT